MLIAQLTDTHIKPDGRPAYGRVDTLSCLKASINHINTLQPAPDVVLVSGDLVDLGTAEEYTLIRSLLDELQMPWMAVPGNHDNREEMQSSFGDCDWMPESAPFIQYAIDDYPLRLIGLDSLKPNSGGGQICSERCDWLDQTLAQQPDKDTLLFIHHPPFNTGIRHMDQIGLEGSDHLAEVVQRHPQVKMLLCGHVHRSVQTIWKGIHVVIAQSPAHAVTLDISADAESSFVMEPPAVQLIRYENNELVTHLSFVGEFSGPWPFCHPDGSLIN
ncbi:phosphodiesterase [Spongorhabdus nitratireducens]